MISVGITQRVVDNLRYPERRDCLDQRWAPLLVSAGLLPVPLPNDPAAAVLIARELRLKGLILTGGNDHASVGGDAPERDRTEGSLLDYASLERLPVFAVCRGMQVLQVHFGGKLKRVAGHVGTRLQIQWQGSNRAVGGYHDWATDDLLPAFEPLSYCDDGVLMAMRHKELPMLGVMWHPERETPVHSDDIALLKKMFAK